MIDQRMAPVNDLLGQFQHQQQAGHQQQVQQANSEVAAFGKNAEFLNDVRHDMADLVDMAHGRGQTMTLQDAYNKACALNPQIAQVLEERATTAKLMGDQNTLASKRNAASSLSGRRAGNGGGGAMDMRSAISDAWDESTGR